MPECNFLHGFFRCKLPVEVVDVEVKITSMQGTHILRRDQTTQLIKCTPWNTRLHPHPTIINKMKTFLEMEGKMSPFPVPVSQFIPPLPDTNPNIRKNNATEKRKRGTPKKFRPATPNLMQCVCPYQRPHQNLRMMHPYPQYQSMRAPHGLVQAKCQVTYLRTEIGCSHQIIWTMPKRTRQKMNLKPQPMSQAPSLRLKKKKNLRQVNNPQKNAVGNQVAPFANLKNRRKSKARCNHKSYHLKQSSKPQDPKTLSLNMTKAKQLLEEEMERLNSKYNLDCYHYEHGYETLIKKCKNEFVRLNFAKTSFSKTNLLVEFSKYK